MGENKNKNEKNKEERPFWLELLSYVVLIAIVLLIKQFVASPIRVNGLSMVPTLENEDYMILNKIGYRIGKIKRFDIVVIRTEDSYIIKRVIGLPGEKVEYRNNKLYIDDKYVKEDYTREDMSDYNIKELGNDKVPTDAYFVLGDNRPISKDSRQIGFISKDDILGKTKTVLYPFSRFGAKE